MKNKTLILIVSGILLLVVVLIIISRLAPQTQPISENLTSTLLENANVTIPQLDPTTSVKLTGETTMFSPFTDESDNATGQITVVGNAVGDNQTIYTILAINTGGSGTFFYLTAFDNSPNGYIAKAFEPLGDRIKFETITLLNSNTVTVSYFTHGPTQSMADEPNQSVSQSYIYSNGIFAPSGN